MDFALKSDIGRLRKLNEDYCGCYFKDDSNLSLFVLADGMGGHNAGEIASKISVETILSTAVAFINSNQEHLEEAQIKKLSVDAIKSANEQVVTLAKCNTSMQGMGTTIVTAAIWDNRVCIAHVGDSRAYFISNNTIWQLTVDHSYVEELVKRGMISREEAKYHPDRNMITRAVGVEDSVEVDVDVIGIGPGDAILLCSDGLTNLMDEQSILEVFLKEKNAEDICNTLLAEANHRGGHDNITAIVIRKTTKDKSAEEKA